MSGNRAVLDDPRLDEPLSYGVRLRLLELEEPLSEEERLQVQMLEQPLSREDRRRVFLTGWDGLVDSRIMSRELALERVEERNQAEDRVFHHRYDEDEDEDSVRSEEQASPNKFKFLQEVCALEDRELKDGEGTCGICHEEYHTGSEPEFPVKLSCNHRFGNKCLTTWVSPREHESNNTCPMCRTILFEIDQQPSALEEAVSEMELEWPEGTYLADDENLPGPQRRILEGMAQQLGCPVRELSMQIRLERLESPRRRTPISQNEDERDFAEMISARRGIPVSELNLHVAFKKHPQRSGRLTSVDLINFNRDLIRGLAVLKSLARDIHCLYERVTPWRDAPEVHVPSYQTLVRTLLSADSMNLEPLEFFVERMANLEDDLVRRGEIPAFGMQHWSQHEWQTESETESETSE